MRNTFYLGIDQHASQLTISLRNEDVDVVIHEVRKLGIGLQNMGG